MVDADLEDAIQILSKDLKPAGRRKALSSMAPHLYVSGVLISGKLYGLNRNFEMQGMAQELPGNFHAFRMDYTSDSISTPMAANQHRKLFSMAES